MNNKANDNFDYAFIEVLETTIERKLTDCLKDHDLIKGKPLEISLDYNGYINSLGVKSLNKQVKLFGPFYRKT